jgi:putative heme iron utilization protein
MAETASRPQRSFSGDDMRRILRRARLATLSTLSTDDGSPYGSLCNVATDVQGYPLILVSRLALHTQNLLKDGRASVMVSELPLSGDALTGQRVTVTGRFEMAEAPALRRRYMARHPASSFYAGFADFSLWRMAPTRAHGVAGFGRIETLPAAEVFPDAGEMEELEASALEHMNADHAEAIGLYARKLLGLEGGGWRMAGIDCDGAELMLDQESAFLPFETRVTHADALRSAFASLSAKARAL